MKLNHLSLILSLSLFAMAASGMSFNEAKAHVVPTLDNVNRTVGEIGVTDAGLRYLNWYCGESFTETDRPYLARYFSEPVVHERLDTALGDDDRACQGE